MQNPLSAQFALTCGRAQKLRIVPILGTTKLHRLQENIRAITVQLMTDDIIELNSAVVTIEVHGARYPERLQKMAGR
jgi:aryl-alcohol dehydrogenase-like predicted oxidoreductase